MGIWPNGPRLNDQDIADVHWFTVVKALKREQENNEIEKMNREMSHV